MVNSGSFLPMSMADCVPVHENNTQNMELITLFRYHNQLLTLPCEDWNGGTVRERKREGGGVLVSPATLTIMAAAAPSGRAL